MEDYEIGIAILIFICGLYLGLLIGVCCADPNELDNGCIVHDDNIYCEVAK